MKILKFGGTSVGSARGLSCIDQIVRAERGSLVVVVSALGGVTDQLLRIADMARQADMAYETELAQLVQRHRQCVEDSVPVGRREHTHAQLAQMFDELTAVLKGVSLVGELSSGTSALVVSYGERMSSVIVSRILDGATHIDSRDVFCTKPYFNRYILDFPATLSNIKREIEPLMRSCERQVVVMGGFISSDLTTGRVTNLGRGGSDYTAAVLASALEARLLEIYTDVDGFMTADPRIAPAARLIRSLDFVQAMELCNYGAKVLYAPTIFPAYNHNIPIVIKNTFNHLCSGTFIDAHARKQPGVLSGIASIRDAALITIRSSGQAVGRRKEGTRWLSYRLYRALARAGVTPFFQSVSAEGSLSIGVADGAVKGQALEVLRAEFAQEIAMGQILSPEVRSGLSTVALVGTQVASAARAAMLGALEADGVEIVAANPDTDSNVAIVVPAEQMQQSIRVTHGLFFERPHVHVTVSVDGVEGLAEWIEQRNEQLVEQQNIRLVVVPTTQQVAEQSPHKQPQEEQPQALQEQAQVRVRAAQGGVVMINDTPLLALGVAPYVYQVLDGFRAAEDAIRSVEAVLEASDEGVARLRASLLAEGAGFAQVPIVFTGSFSAGGKVRMLIDSVKCSVEPLPEPNADKVSCYMAVRSARFEHYPLHVWLPKIDLQTIYSVVLQLAGK